MSGSCKNRCKRIFAVLVAVLLLVILFFAATLIVENLEHDCEGEHCPVCACIQVCEAILHQIGAGLLPVFGAVLVIATALVTVSGSSAVFVPQNLISLKIRLNILFFSQSGVCATQISEKLRKERK